MTEIQEYLLKLVCEIDEICTEHHIDYVLFGGSSLGVERNEGFLPWDDDLDLLMTKDNYLRFVEVMKTEPRKGRVLESPEVNPEFPLHFGKYMSTESSGLIRSLAYGNAHAGIWIDIFYLCPLSNDPEEAAEMLLWFQAYCEYQNRRFAEVPIYTEGLAEKYKAALDMEKKIGREKTLQWLEKKFDYVAEEDCERYFLHHALTPTVKVYSKRHMKSIERRLFNGKWLPFSSTNRELCREAYGDSWMMIPDVNQQEIHDAILDIDKPYTIYQQDFMALLDKETVDQDLLEYKKNEFFNKQKRYNANRGVGELHALIDETALAKTLDAAQIEDLYAKQRWRDLSEAFTLYRETLAEPIYKLYNIVPQLPGRLSYIFLESIIRQNGAWSYAEKMLPHFHTTEEERDRLQHLITNCRQISVSRYDKRDPDTTLRQITSWDMEHGGQCYEIDMARLYVCCENYDIPGLVGAIESLKDTYDTSAGELLLAKAIVEKHAGNTAAHDHLINELFENCKNGVLLLDVQKGRYEFSI